MQRREFLQGALGGLSMTALRAYRSQTSSAGSQDEGSFKIKDYRLLGRTGFRVSDISAGQVFDEGVLRILLERGVNYIDTSELYETVMRHETTIGRVLKVFDRKRLFITTKLVPGKHDTKESYLARARKRLECLKVDSLDCLMLHSPDSVQMVKDGQFHAAVSELKTEGRVRHVGLSCHGALWFNKTKDTMEQILGAAIEDGRFDVVLVAYNYLNQDQGGRILKACRTKGIGTTLMKTDPTGGGINLFGDMADQAAQEGKELEKWQQDVVQLRKENREKAKQFMLDHGLRNFDDARAAAIRFVLANPDVNTAVLTIRTYEEADRILALSGSKLSAQDRRMLGDFAALFGSSYCRHACGLCEPACPREVPVNTIMRYHTYFVAQKLEKQAISDYARIPGPRAESCGICHAPCQRACPYGVAIQAMLARAHEDLTLLSSCDNNGRGPAAL